MKRTDIRAGVVYAIKHDRGAPSPVMFLEDRAAGIYSRQRGGGIRQRAEDSRTKAHRGHGFSDETIGYAAVVQDWTTPGTSPAQPPWNLDPAAELEQFRGGGSPSAQGLRFDLITSLGKVAPWDETVAEDEARRAAGQAAREKSDAHRARVQAARDGLAEFGIDAGYSFGNAKIELAVWEVEKLLALLRGRED